MRRRRLFRVQEYIKYAMINVHTVQATHERMQAQKPSSEAQQQTESLRRVSSNAGEVGGIGTIESLQRRELRESNCVICMHSIEGNIHMYCVRVYSLIRCIE